MSSTSDFIRRFLIHVCRRFSMSFLNFLSYVSLLSRLESNSSFFPDLSSSISWKQHKITSCPAVLCGDVVSCADVQDHISLNIIYTLNETCRVCVDRTESGSDSKHDARWCFIVSVRLCQNPREQSMEPVKHLCVCVFDAY